MVPGADRDLTVSADKGPVAADRDLGGCGARPAGRGSTELAGRRRRTEWQRVSQVPSFADLLLAFPDEPADIPKRKPARLGNPDLYCSTQIISELRKIGDGPRPRYDFATRNIRDFKDTGVDP